MSLNISSRGIDFIVSFEGKKTLLADGRYQAYLDTLAKPATPTIYCGLTKGVKMGMVLTEAQCQNMFSRELAIYDNAVDELVTGELTQNAHDACVSFVYNCGIGAFKKSTLLKLINQGKFEQAAAQFAKWNKAGGRVWPGLVRRRAAEAALFLEPPPAEEPQHIPVREPSGEVVLVPDNAMPQRVEPSNPSLINIAAYSNTIRAAALAVAGTLVQVWNWIFGVAKESGPDIVSNQEALSPFGGLLNAIGANMGLIAALVVLGSLGAVIVNRLNRDRA